MKARDLYAEELDVVSVIQQRRFFNMALKKLLKKKKRRKLIKKSIKTDIRSDTSSSSQDDKRPKVKHDSGEKGRSDQKEDVRAPPTYRDIASDKHESADFDPLPLSLFGNEEESHDFGYPAQENQ